MKQFEGFLAAIKARSHGLQRIAIFFGTILAITAAMVFVISDVLGPAEYSEGEVAKHSVRAPKEFLVEDAVSTAERRVKAASVVKKVFTFDDTAEASPAVRLEDIFAELRTAAEAPPEGERLTLTSEDKSNIERRFQINLSSEEWNLILDPAVWSEIKTDVVNLVQPITSLGIIANKKSIPAAASETGAVLRSKATADERQFSPTALLDLREANEELQAAFPKAGLGKGAVFDSLVKKLSSSLAKANVVYDFDETERRIRQAKEEVEPIYYRIRQGEVIVRAGDIVSAAQEKRLHQLAALQAPAHVPQLVGGFLLLCTLVILSSFLFATAIRPNFRPSNLDLGLLAAVLVGSVGFLWLASVVAPALNFAFPDIDKAAFMLVAPVATGGILLQVTLGSTAVLLFTFCFALISGIFLEDSWIFLLMIVIGNLLGSISVKSCSRRSAFLTAGSRVALANLTIILSFLLIYPEYQAAEYAVRVLCALASGLLSGLMASALAPVAEYFGSYITDIKLLELASLDRPLLRDLSVQCPGTWNHSMVMGQLAEAAAEAVGANRLLCRVGAYYHDIGKVKKPAYFAENQVSKDNRHDRLTPSMSALIIKTHVKDGMELARQHHLPDAVIDLIPQHHGTSLIEYFYDKALKEAGEDEVIDETHYRYPGPKPQTKEAGIIMLSDAVEASSRTLLDPSPAKIQGLVQKMINKIFASGQLDECELTLKDLHLIAKSFTRVLTGIFHRRIEYSEPAEKTRAERRLDDTVMVDNRPPVVLQDEPVEAPVPAEAAPEENGGQKRDGGRTNGETNGGKRSEGSAKKPGAQNGKEALKRLGM